MKRLSLVNLQAVAESRGGRCLSESYSHSSQIISWECERGHTWESAARNVIHSGAWCPYCAGRRHNLTEMKSVAISRGGNCISDKYDGMQSKLTWVCAHGHKWKSTPANILVRGAWCPECSSGLGERISRVVISHLTGCSFPKVRPAWLKSFRGTQLELDGYAEEIKVAFEHQGEQHYSSTSYYSNSEIFSRRILDDEAKRVLCRENGVILVEIPEIGTRLPVNQAQEFLAKILASHQIKLPGISTPADLSPAYSSNGAAEALDALRRQASIYGGEIIDSHYHGSKAHHKFRCQHGHIWQTSADSIMRGRWCPYCSANKKADETRNSIEKVQAYGLAKGGRLLSAQYVNSSQPLIWECKKGHQWSAPFNAIRNGKWCPRCARWSIEELNDLAKERGGRVVSSVFYRLSEPIEWECVHGHRWLARPGNVINGTWCPMCHKSRSRQS